MHFSGRTWARRLDIRNFGAVDDSRLILGAICPQVR
jgi:hypothetical protein